jgi:predicted hydrolase (HD superfamily)
MKNFHEKVFIKELGRDILDLVEALTVESDERVNEAVEELKALKASKADNGQQ